MHYFLKKGKFFFEVQIYNINKNILFNYLKTCKSENLSFYNASITLITNIIIIRRNGIWIIKKKEKYWQKYKD